MVTDLEFFKIRSHPIAPYVFSRLDHTRISLENGTKDPPLCAKLIEKCASRGVDPIIYKTIFGEVYKQALIKFKKHIDRHNALPLFRSIQCFDPKYIQAQSNRHDLNNYREINEFSLLENNLINEWGVYCRLKESFKEDFDLNNYWIEKSNTLPILSKIALIYIWLPISGVDVERSFSAYKNILNDRRRRLSENSIKMLNFLYYNSNK